MESQNNFLRQPNFFFEGMKGPNIEVLRNHQEYFTDKNREILKRKVEKPSCLILITHSDIPLVNIDNSEYLILETRLKVIIWKKILLIHSVPLAWSVNKRFAGLGFTSLPG